MPLKPSQINTFLFLKLPSAFFCGVRLKSISETSCTTTVKHRWINQNPFKSIFWAVQGMAAELSTGALVMSYIKECNKPISMLVANNKATFNKKAKGRITFECTDGILIKEAINATIASGEGQTCWMKSVGKDAAGDIVSGFEFEWTVKIRS
ncbi:uncharacterized protein DUF4442 [Ulvibacter sp. MAR_2010_11]|uniref:DUF4442 domain-containing protein n=1 Tax=Ulvibacter sp. MAR_2010_11 TaxID=1250229 RepID=UPI000C2C2614|nr:DUF4442 domain-containing protein [Ulvibacter sp. MAR_2010_11]PKA83840.1 uncharacterized protein DUF4442 [Ulvibacter sp. MAR_2010_11]